MIWTILYDYILVFNLINIWLNNIYIYICKDHNIENSCLIRSLIYWPKQKKKDEITRTLNIKALEPLTMFFLIWSGSVSNWRKIGNIWRLIYRVMHWLMQHHQDSQYFKGMNLSDKSMWILMMPHHLELTDHSDWVLLIIAPMQITADEKQKP